MFLLICNVTKNRQTLFLSIQLPHNVNFLNKLSKKVLPLYKLEMELWLGFIIKFLKKSFFEYSKKQVCRATNSMETTHQNWWYLRIVSSESQEEETCESVKQCCSLNFFSIGV